MATNLNPDNGVTIKRGWLLEKLIAVLQAIIIVIVVIIWGDLREVRDGYIKYGVKQDGLVTDVKNVEYTVRDLNDTVQRLVGHEEAKNH